MRTTQVGARRAVVDEIGIALRQAVDGVGPRTVVITAGPGSGKTHMLHQLVAGLNTASRWSTADELSWRQPYGVLSDLVDLSPPTPVPADFDAELFARIEAACAEAPHVLVVDDAHNADAGSLEILGRLAAAAREVNLVLLVARKHLPARELLTRLMSRPTVREWKLPPMDAVDLEALTHQVLGAWPDERLAEMLAHAGGNPMHAVAMLNGMRAQGAVVVNESRATAHLTATEPVPASLDDAIREQLALLDDASRGLLQKLAIWGGPATLIELAAVDGAAPASMVLAAQTAIDAGVVAASERGELAFTHDAYADAVYGGLAPALRSVVHTAIARHHESVGNRQMVAHHLLAAGTDVPAAAAAVSSAQQELSHAPAVEIDLLDAAVRQAPGLSSPSRTLELDLATALARTGQLERAAEVATDGLEGCADLDTIARLHRIVLFTLMARGKSTEVRELVTATMQLPIDDVTRNVLVSVERYIKLLAGATAVPSDPFPVHDDGGPVTGIVAEGLRRFLSGDPAGGLELALLASAREGAADGGFEISTSAEIWPPFIDQYLHGPAAAEALMDRAAQLRRDRGVAWMTAYHEFTRGGIAMARGRLGDAAALFDAGLERADAAGMGWTSLAEGGRAMIDVYRGDFAEASTRLETFTGRGLPNQFGIPAIDRSRLLLLEAQRKLRPAAAAARECWTRATDLRLNGWLPAAGLDCARVAHRSNDTELVDLLADGLAGLTATVSEAFAGPVALALALCGNDPDAITAAAVACARTAHDQGDLGTEACAWEEAACAAARAGDKTAARGHARSALVLTQHMDATALSNRVVSRLRALGLRLDATATQDRPRAGWESLTRTEVTVAELVAAGLSGNEIATRLYVSPRTVQTHVSHALAKLGLRSRVDLAAFVAGRHP
jgi:DNA-binding CsgD family transcriptional regulator